MIKTVLLALLLLTAVVLYVWAVPVGREAQRMNDRDRKSVATGMRASASIALALFVLLGIWSCTFHVGAKQYGVLTTYGHPSSHDYGSGLHLKAPWQRDVPVDGKVQTYGFTSDRDDSGYTHKYNAIPTVIGNGAPTNVSVSVRWQVAEDQASVLYQNFGTGDPTDHFGQSVIHAQMLQVIPVVMRTYNPIAQLTVLKGRATGQSAENASFAPDYDALSRLAATILQERVKGEATIQSVAISSAPLDPATQQKLSQFIQEQAKTRTALQAIETTNNQAQANRNLEASLAKSPGLLVQHCLDGVEDAITKGYALPAGYSCFSGGSVVIPGTNK